MLTFVSSSGVYCLWCVTKFNLHSHVGDHREEAAWRRERRGSIQWSCDEMRQDGLWKAERNKVLNNITSIQHIMEPAEHQPPSESEWMCNCGDEWIETSLNIAEYESRYSQTQHIIDSRPDGEWMTLNYLLDILFVAICVYNCDFSVIPWS